MSILKIDWAMKMNDWSLLAIGSLRLDTAERAAEKPVDTYPFV